MLKLIRLMIVATLLGAFAAGAWAAEKKYIPGVKILLEVRTAKGDLRSFQHPGAPPTYWNQDMPVVRGDKVTITPIIATGGAELGIVKVRLDSKEIATGSQANKVEVDTATLTEGYHLVEVWAKTKQSRAKDNSGTTTFLVVPSNDPLVQMTEGGTEAGPPVSQEERLSSAIRSRNEKVDKELLSSFKATVNSPTLFYVSAGETAKEFFYTLSREGQVTYTSSKLPLMTHIELGPQQGEGVGQAPGNVVLTVRVGDGAGHFGAPTWVTVQIEAGQGK